MLKKFLIKVGMARGKNCITGLLCIQLLFTLNIVGFHSLPEVQQLEKNNEQIAKNTITAASPELEITFECKEWLPMSPKLLSEEIIYQIKSRLFSAAEDMLSQMNISTYYYVVHEVYNNQPGNFDLLLDFGDSIRDNGVKFKIYNILYNNTEASDLNDHWKLLRLRQSVKTTLDGNVSSAAYSLYHTLMNTIKEAAIEPISKTFQNDIWWSKLRQLSTYMHDECKTCIGEIYDSVIATLWNKITLDDILSKAHEHLKYIDEKMAIHQAVINKLNHTGLLYQTATITLARYMKLEIDSADYRNMESTDQSIYKELVRKLPKSVKNLVFSSEVYLRNVELQEYLHASPKIQVSSNNYARHVFTSKAANYQTSDFKWRVTFVDKFQVQLRNVQYDQVLFAAATDWVSWNETNKRYVFTWNVQNHHCVFENCYWNVEVKGDAVYLRNVYYNNEFSFADSNKKFDNDNRYVFTLINYNGVRDPVFKWEVLGIGSWE